MTIKTKPARTDYRENPLWGEDNKARACLTESAELTPEQRKLLELPSRDRRRYLEGDWNENN